MHYGNVNVILTKLSSLPVQNALILTTFCAVSYENLVNIAQFSFHYSGSDMRRHLIICVCACVCVDMVWGTSPPNSRLDVRQPTCELTHWGWDKMDATSQTTFSNAFSWMKMLGFRLKFHWSLFLMAQLTIFQQWFRKLLGADQATSHYMMQWWLFCWRIYASLGLNELRLSIFNKPVPVRYIWDPNRIILVSADALAPSIVRPPSSAMLATKQIVPHTCVSELGHHRFR